MYVTHIIQVTRGKGLNPQGFLYTNLEAQNMQVCAMNDTFFFDRKIDKYTILCKDKKEHLNIQISFEIFPSVLYKAK